MKRIIVAAFVLGMAGPVVAEELEHCSITPVSQVGYIGTFTKPDECVEACKTTEGCDSWSFLPHSFDAEKPGSCKLIKGIFKKEDSERSFCGEL